MSILFRKLLVLIRKFFVLPIVLYQRTLSRILPASCIYYPSCSQYAKESILMHGVLKGLVLGTARILRCVGGLYSGGEDPVPEEFSLQYVFGSFRKFWALGR